MLFWAQVFFSRHSYVICDTVIQLTSYRAQVIRKVCLGELYLCWRSSVDLWSALFYFLSKAVFVKSCSLIASTYQTRATTRSALMRDVNFLAAWNVMVEWCKSLYGWYS